MLLHAPYSFYIVGGGGKPNFCGGACITMRKIIPSVLYELKRPMENVYSLVISLILAVGFKAGPYEQCKRKCRLVHTIKTNATKERYACVIQLLWLRIW